MRSFVSSINPLLGKGFLLHQGEKISSEEGEVTILSADLLLKGDYLRSGDDLVIQGKMGEQVVVEGYFSNGGSLPLLKTPAGAQLSPDVVLKLLINHQGVEVAGPADTLRIPGALGASIGTVDDLGAGGKVTAKGSDGSIRQLKVGDEIYKGDVIETVGRSYAGLRMKDDTSFQLGKETRAIIEDYQFEPADEKGQGGEGKFEATVTTGFFRYASGGLGKLGKGGHHSTIKTPTAQIGIRGSELQGQVESDGSSTFVHQSGILDVSDANGEGTVTLDTPGTATGVRFGAGAPTPVFEAPAALLASFEASMPPLPTFVEEARAEEVLEEGEEGEEEEEGEEDAEEGEDEEGDEEGEEGEEELLEEELQEELMEELEGLFDELGGEEEGLDELFGLLGGAEDGMAEGGLEEAMESLFGEEALAEFGADEAFGDFGLFGGEEGGEEGFAGETFDAGEMSGVFMDSFQDALIGALMDDGGEEDPFEEDGVEEDPAVLAMDAYMDALVDEYLDSLADSDEDDSDTDDPVAEDAVEQNSVPTLTVFLSAVDETAFGSEVEITLADLKAAGNEADSDGSVVGFQVMEVSSGSLKIGASSEAATDYDADTNNLIGVGYNAYWTPDSGAEGVQNAFTVVAEDDAGETSEVSVQATVTVQEQSSALKLDGSGDYVTLGDALNDVFGSSSNTFKVEVSLNPTTLATGVTNHGVSNVFFAKASDAYNDNLEIGVSSTGNLLLYIDTDNVDPSAVSFGPDGAIATGQYSDISVEYSSGEVTVVINGTTYTDSTWSAATYLDNSTGSLATIGASTHEDQYFTGGIKTVKIYQNDDLQSSYIFSGDNPLNDLSGTNHGTFVGDAEVAAIRTSLSFDGADDYLEATPDSGELLFSTNNALTAQAWVNLTPENYDFWLTMNEGSDIAYRFGSNSSGNLFWDQGYHQDKTSTDYTFTSSEWTHVVFTTELDPSTSVTTKVYVNGSLVATEVDTGAMATGLSELPEPTQILIGSGESGGTHNFKGSIDELAVWNQALDAEAVTALYNSGSGLDASSNSGDYDVYADNLVGYWKFDEGSGSTAGDSSGSANSATINGASWLVDPIVIDLDGDGVELVQASPTNSFSMVPDGSASPLNWISDDDALLVYDRNQNGRVDDITELFSEYYASGVDTGLGALSTLDGNGDGTLDHRDAQFSSLQIWQDQNGDGVSSVDELRSLSEISVSAIGLDAQQTPATILESQLLSTGLVQLEGGDSLNYSEVALAVTSSSVVDKLAIGDLLDEAGQSLAPDLVGAGVTSEGWSRIESLLSEMDDHHLKATVTL